jgi:hypothetical protein
MPALINLATNALLGVAFALVARRSPAFKESLLSWPLLFAAAFEAVVFTPIATYLFRFYPQWSMLYWFDPQLYPELDGWIGLLSALAILANFGALVGSFVLARSGILKHKDWQWIAPAAAGGLLLLIVLILFGDRVVFIGDYDGYVQGNASVLFKRFAGWVGMLLYAGTIGFTLWVRARFSHEDPKII